MIRRTLLALVAFGIAACGMHVHFPAKKNTDPLAPLAKLAFEDACRLTSYDCSDLIPPDLIVVNLTEKGLGGGTKGIYAGGMAIYLSSELDGKSEFYKYAVVVHETVHYIQAMAPNRVHLLPGCWREGEAFFASNTILWELGAGEEQLLTWWDGYWNCGQQHEIEAYDELLNNFNRTLADATYEFTPIAGE